MAVEYIDKAIKATAGQPITVMAEITDDDGAMITEDCGFRIYDLNEEMITRVDGVFSEEDGYWTFTIPAELTEGRKGRHWYCICHKGHTLIFRHPLYLV